jgi:hypothetical protein
VALVPDICCATSASAFGLAVCSIVCFTSLIAIDCVTNGPGEPVACVFY